MDRLLNQILIPRLEWKQIAMQDNLVLQNNYNIF